MALTICEPDGFVNLDKINLYRINIVQSISAKEAAHRLGVKPATLYAYVSRGLVTSAKSTDGRASRFDAEEIERLSRTGRRAHRPTRTGSVDVVIATGITRIDNDLGPVYRRRPAVELAQIWSFEQAADWLWTGVEPDGSTQWPDPESSRQGASPAGDPWPLSAKPAPTHRLLRAAALLASTDPYRHDLRPEAVAAAGRQLINAFADAPPAGKGRRSGSVAERLWARLSRRPGTDAAVGVLDAALVLLADHDLAPSTLAARVAASTRADPYAVVANGLGTLSGPLHGGASRAAYRLFVEAELAGGPAPVLGELLRRGESIPGFGHKIYTDVDPRARALWRLFIDADFDPKRIAVAEELLTAATARIPVKANIDFAIAAFTYAAGLPDDTGEWIMAIARTVGWLAHAMEEYRETPLRFRPRAEYIGP